MEYYLRNSFKKELGVWFVAFTSFFTGLFIILWNSLIRFPHIQKISQLLVPYGLYHFSRMLTLLLGFILLYLSFELLQRKIMAWRLSLILSVLVIFSNIGKLSSWYEYLLPSIMLLTLIFFQKNFTVVSGPVNIKRGVKLAIFSIAIAVAYGVIGFFLLDKNDFGINFQLWDSFLRTIRELTFIGNRDIIAHTRHAKWFLDSLDFFGITAVLLALYSLFKPLSYKFVTHPLEREIVKSILQEYGSSSIDYFRIWEDKSYFFSETKKSCISYTTMSGCAIALGDPVGPKNELEGIVKGFITYCKENGWKVAFFQTLPGNISVYKNIGFKNIKIEQEAIVDLDHFCTSTINTKEFRRVRKNFSGAGFKVEIFNPPHPHDLLDVLKIVSDEWLTFPGKKEHRFSLGSFNRGYVDETKVISLRNPDGKLIAYINLIPSYTKDLAAIDLMRHRKNIPNGTMDYLFLSVMEILYKQGFKKLSLGGAPLTGIGEEKDARIEEKVLKLASDKLNSIFSFRTLREYKSKFEPDWQNRHLIYLGGPRTLIQIAFAIVKLVD
jgi:phosphatidylglycerol lysyltransferase